MNKIVHAWHIVTFGLCCLICAGCGAPPDHCANWWYYWKDGAVVDDMDKVKYLWDESTTRRGLSSPHKSHDLVALGDPALDPITWTITRQNKNNPLITKTVWSPLDGGIDGVAEVIAHEFKHVWVHEQWAANIGATGVIDGRQHTDTDAIPDAVETSPVAGSIGDIYEFDPADPDTFDMQSIGGWGGYAGYGDNEILARVEGIANPRGTAPEKDWSKGGKQWHH